MSTESGSIKLQYGIYAALPEDAYVVRVTFPTTSPEEPIVHFMKVNKALDRLGVKLIVVLEKGFNYLGVAFRGSEMIHQIIVETLIESGFMLESSRYTGSEQLRRDLILSLDTALSTGSITMNEEKQVARQYLKLLRAK